MLWKSEQYAGRAERIRGGIGLDVIFHAQPVLVAYLVFDIRDSLVDVRFCIGPLHYRVIAQYGCGSRIGDLSARNQILTVGALGLQ